MRPAELEASLVGSASESPGRGPAVILSSDCNNKQWRRRRKCKNIPLGVTVSWEAAVTLRDCKPHTLHLSPVGMADVLEVELEPVCQCECGAAAAPSPHCSNRGQLLCGQCSCFDNPQQGNKGPNSKHDAVPMEFYIISNVLEMKIAM